MPQPALGNTNIIQPALGPTPVPGFVRFEPSQREGSAIFKPVGAACSRERPNAVITAPNRGYKPLPPGLYPAPGISRRHSFSGQRTNETRLRQRGNQITQCRSLTGPRSRRLPIAISGFPCLQQIYGPGSSACSINSGKAADERQLGL